MIANNRASRSEAFANRALADSAQAYRSHAAVSARRQRKTLPVSVVAFRVAVVIAAIVAVVEIVKAF